MKVFILTSSLRGTAAHHLPILLGSEVIKVQGVIFGGPSNVSFDQSFRRKFNKIKKIGIFGALNGIRMRKWYRSELYFSKKVKPLDLLCQEFNIPFYDLESTNSKETLEVIDSLNSDLGISLGNAYISEDILVRPKYGMINVHHEELPDYQNAQSIIWQIHNLSPYSGFTIHKMNKYIDEGDILYKKRIKINFKKNLKETVSFNYNNLIELSALGLLELIESYDLFNSEAIPQGKGKKYTTPSIKQMYRIYKNFKLLKDKIITAS